MTRIYFFGQTDAGVVRTNNEDAFFVDEQRGIGLVADGIGGVKGGEIASSLFATEAESTFPLSGVLRQADAAHLVRQGFQRANGAIMQFAKTHPEYKGMGCTAELISFFPSGFILGHMGDSRSFRLRDSSFKQLTTDHSLVQEQLDKGLISNDEARNHSYKNVILRAVGIEETPQLDIIKGKVFPGDLFLLCSDGLTDMVEAPLIEAMLRSGDTIDAMAGALINQAKANGGKDNITLVLAQVN